MVKLVPVRGMGRQLWTTEKEQRKGPGCGAAQFPPRLPRVLRREQL